MRCATDSEISDWLEERSLVKDPYRGGSSPDFYLQFYVPTKHRCLDFFTRDYYLGIIPESESLIHMTDWPLYQPSEMMAVTGIRSSQGDDRLLINAPGHCLTPEEMEIGVALFSISASFEWNADLYSPVHRSTLYNWEGEIFDFWTDSETAFTKMKLILERFELPETLEGHSLSQIHGRRK